jgi:hypothetical protein
MVEIIPLPPCADPLPWAAKVKALEYTFRGVNTNSDGSDYYGTDPHSWNSLTNKHLDDRRIYEILRSMNASKITPSCVPRKNHFVAMATLSRTVNSKMCHGSGCVNPNSHNENAPETEDVFDTPMPSMAEVKQMQTDPTCITGPNEQDLYQTWCCSNECVGTSPPSWCADNCGADYLRCCSTFNQASYQPPSLEERVKTGDVKLLLGNRLFQKGCLNYQCKYGIEPCSAVSLKPAGNAEILVASFEADRDKLVEKVEGECFYSFGRLLLLFICDDTNN